MGFDREPGNGNGHGPSEARPLADIPTRELIEDTAQQLGVHDGKIDALQEDVRELVEESRAASKWRKLADSRLGGLELGVFEILGLVKAAEERSLRAEKAATGAQQAVEEREVTGRHDFSEIQARLRESSQRDAELATEAAKAQGLAQAAIDLAARRRAVGSDPPSLGRQFAEVALSKEQAAAALQVKAGQIDLSHKKKDRDLRRKLAEVFLVAIISGLVGYFLKQAIGH
jgi:hypothetical protein